MNILIGNEKGGVGKSTIAINLAVSYALKGKDVMILDTDRQNTATNFINSRTDNKILPKIHCVQKFGDVFDTIKDFESRYEIVIIDAGGQDSSELRSAMIAVSKMIIPMKPSQIDLWAAARMNDNIGMVKNINRTLKINAILSMATTNPVVKEDNDAIELIKEYENLPLLKTIIRDRKVYRDSIIAGKGVKEMNNSKAIEEIDSFMEEISE